ncbi:MAG: flavin reductase, partial [Campylobacter sp.]
MAITWAQALDYDKVTIVPHNGSYTRTLIEKSGYFAVQIPTAAQAELVSELGAENNSRFDNADKMKNVEIFYKDDFDVPLIAGCAAWLVCKRIPEPHNEQ